MGVTRRQAGQMTNGTSEARHSFVVSDAYPTLVGWW